MTKKYLIEVGMEEIPARFLLELRHQLENRVINFFNDERISYEEVESFATPRRLAVRVSGLLEKQESISEKVKGPSLKIAKDEAGEWTKAALGFIKGQGADVDDITIESIKEEEYIFVEKNIEGLKLEEIISQISRVLSSMTFPVSMTWHNYKKPYIRPIHWIVSLLEEEVIPFKFYGVEASNYSYGHRFLGRKTVIKHPDDYEQVLEKEFVLVNYEKRKSFIIQQIKEIAESNQWQVPIDEDLLDEVTSIVEWPYAFSASFEEKYLQVPEIVLITAMRDHQRYFFTLNETKQLLPNFISVRNGNGEYIDNVIKGNQKVLRARLEDALFFYLEDTSHDLAYFTDKLKHIKEHYLLDSLASKQLRVSNIITHLAKAVNEVDAGKIAHQAADIYKFDLASQVVEEFSELQGKIGQIYAENYHIDDKVAQAIGEQYLPDHSGGDLPQTKGGALLALADKIDTLLSYFNINLIPTGSNDPYGLRRQAMGIVEIIAAYNWSLNLNHFIQLLVNEMKVENENLVEDFVDFIKARTEQYLEKISVNHDIIQGVLAGKEMNITRAISFAKALQNLKVDNSKEYQKMVESLTRVINLGVSEEAKSQRLDISLAETHSESNLINFVSNNLILDSNKPLNIFLELSDPIQAYFEENMVNSEKRKIKRNRLATMKQITDFVLKVMDPRELISKF